MFIKNKYYRWYYQIVDKARKRGVPNDYYERHHIVPTSLGGTDSEFNIVKLTYREHILVHWLLTKMTVGKDQTKMIWALWNMIGVDHVHGQARLPPRWLIALAKKITKGRRTGKNNAFFGKKHTEESLAKMRGPRKGGWKQSSEARLKMKKAATGRKHTPETLKKLSDAKKDKPHSLDQRKNISEGIKIWHEQVARYSDRGKNISKALKGRPHSEERKRKISETLKGKTIPHEVRKKISESIKLIRSNPNSNYPHKVT